MHYSLSTIRFMPLQPKPTLRKLRWKRVLIQHITLRMMQRIDLITRERTELKRFYLFEDQDFVKPEVTFPDPKDITTYALVEKPKR